MPMESLLPRRSVITQDTHLCCSTQQPGGLTDTFATATDHVSALSVVSFVVKAVRANDLNCIKYHLCGVPTHTPCII